MNDKKAKSIQVIGLLVVTSGILYPLGIVDSKTYAFLLITGHY